MRNRHDSKLILYRSDNLLRVFLGRHESEDNISGDIKT